MPTCARFASWPWTTSALTLLRVLSLLVEPPATSLLLPPSSAPYLRRSVEMRSKVLSPLHRLRRTLDTVLSVILPPRPPASILSPPPPATSATSTMASAGAGAALSLTDPFPGQPVRGWSSLYELVTFRADVGYAAALARERWQARVVERGVWGTVGVLGLGMGWGAWVAGKWARGRGFM